MFAAKNLMSSALMACNSMGKRTTEAKRHVDVRTWHIIDDEHLQILEGEK